MLIYNTHYEVIPLLRVRNPTTIYPWTVHPHLSNRSGLVGVLLLALAGDSADVPWRIIRRLSLRRTMESRVSEDAIVTTKEAATIGQFANVSEG
jgi:hypothetical protein